MDYFARFTDGSKNALNNAARYARERGFNYVGTEHLLVGLAMNGDMTSELLESLGATEELLEETVNATIGKGDYVINQNFGYTPRMKKVLEISKAISRQLGNSYVGSEHLLYSILAERECLANRIIRALGLDMLEIEKGIKKITGRGDVKKEEDKKE